MHAVTVIVHKDSKDVVRKALNVVNYFPMLVLFCSDGHPLNPILIYCFILLVKTVINNVGS